MTAHVRMNGHRIAKVIVFPVEIIEVVPPEVLDVLRVHPAVRVGRFLDEHHRWQVIEVPVRGDLDKAGIGTLFERLHPIFRVLAVIDFTPFIAGAEEVGEAVVMAEAVI